MLVILVFFFTTCINLKIPWVRIPIPHRIYEVHTTEIPVSHSHKYVCPYINMGYHTWFCPSPTTYFLFLPLPNEQKYEHFLTVLPGSMNIILCYTICNLSHFFLARSQFGFLQPKAHPHHCNLSVFVLSMP
jgi:hypothetical protein